MTRSSLLRVAVTFFTAQPVMGFACCSPSAIGHQASSFAPAVYSQPSVVAYAVDDAADGVVGDVDDDGAACCRSSE